jgi:hypothetical protein
MVLLATKNVAPDPLNVSVGTTSGTTLLDTVYVCANVLLCTTIDVAAGNDPFKYS